MNNRARHALGWSLAAVLVGALVLFALSRDTLLERVGVFGFTLASCTLLASKRWEWPIVSVLMVAVMFAATLVYFIGWYVDRDGQPATLTEMSNLAHYHRDSLRGPLFSAFLSLGGFLLSLKTFIIVKVKEGLYDNRRYRKRMARMRSRILDEKRRPGIFEPLDRLRRLLFISIVASLLAAIAQVTVGASTGPYTATICLAAAAFVVGVLFQVLLLINANLHDWFKDAEHEAVQEERRAAQDENKAS